MYKLWQSNLIIHGLQVRNASQFERFFPGIDETILKTFLEMNTIDVTGKIWEIPGNILMNLVSRQYNVTGVGIPFLGDVFVLMGSNTIGSANMFAKIMQDLKLGIRVGTPTGFNWNYYGLAVPFEFEDMNDFYFTVSTASFFTPNSPTTTITPNNLFPKSKNDIINSYDSQLQFIIRMFPA